jgi:hypothetical protein
MRDILTNPLFRGKPLSEPTAKDRSNCLGLGYAELSLNHSNESVHKPFSAIDKRPNHDASSAPFCRDRSCFPLHKPYRIRASQHFRSFWGAWRTIAGYEAIHMIRKGQACWSATRAKGGLLPRFILGLFAATN